MKKPESCLYRTQQRGHEHLGIGVVQLEAGPHTAPAAHRDMVSVTSLSPLSFLLQSNNDRAVEKTKYSDTQHRAP